MSCKLRDVMKRIVKHHHTDAERRKIKRLEKKIMADFTKLNTDIATLATDADALIALKPTEDPAIQTGIDAAAAAVQAVDAKVKAALPPTA